jgi:hypothetical protein
MPSNTARNNIRIPLDADPFADGATATRNGLNDVDDLIAAKARRGRTTATTDASGDITITHGLGQAPTSVVVSAGNPTSAFLIAAHTFGATTFKVRYRASNTTSVVASTAGCVCDWLASV